MTTQHAAVLMVGQGKIALSGNVQIALEENAKVDSVNVK